jgi:FkbM family methyltransferase
MASPVRRTLAVDPAVTFQVLVDEAMPDTISRQIREGSFEYPIGLALTLGLLPPGSTVVDVGAHVGTFALAAAARGCRVLAIEASPANVALLRASVALNGFRDLEIVAAAVGDRTGVADFLEAGPYGFVVPVGGRGPTVEVPVTTVDAILDVQGLHRVDAVKLDVEGSEPAAVRGMSRLLTRAEAPFVCYESNGHTLRMLGETPRGLRAALSQHGYRHYRIDPGKLVPLEEADVQVACNIDCLATRRPLELPAGWVIRQALSHAEKLAEILAACRDPHEDHRVHAAFALEDLPREVLADSRVRDALHLLKADFSPRVRAAASTWTAGS